MLTFGCALFIGFAIYVVAPFKQMFNDWSLQLPFITQTLLWWHEIGAWVLAAILVLVASFFIFAPMIAGRARFHRMLTGLPLVGPIFHWSGVAEMLRLLALLIDAGVPLPEALSLSADGVADAHVRERCREFAEGAASGATLTKLIVETGSMPISIAPLLHWGEINDRLPEALRVSAEALEERMESRASLVAGVFPPFVFIVIAALAVFAVLALFLPMTSLITGLF